MQTTEIQPGSRVRVTTSTPKGERFLTHSFEGTVLRMGRQKTGSWFAHSRDKKLWIDRLELKMDDGELRVCNLDQYTRVEVLDGA